MSKKKLLKRIVVGVIAVALSVSSMMGMISASASESNKREWIIEDMLTITDVAYNIRVDCDTYFGGEKGRNKAEKELEAAFDICETEGDETLDEKVTFTINTKDFVFQNSNVYIDNIKTKVDKGHSGMTDWYDFDKIKKDDKGHPCSFSYSYDATKDFVIEGCLFIEIANLNEEVGNVELYIDINTRKELGDNFEIVNGEKEENTEKATKDSNSKKEPIATENTQPKKYSEKADASKNNSQNKKNTPKTADEMSASVKIAIILGSVSIVFLIAICVYRRKHKVNN